MRLRHVTGKPIPLRFCFELVQLSIAYVTGQSLKCCLAVLSVGLALRVRWRSLPAPASFVSDGAPSALGASYRLGIGDKLKITVLAKRAFRRSCCECSGPVALPLAGEVPAQGKTLTQFRETVASRLADGYLKNPKITVEITNYRPFYIHGEVKNGGEFPYKTGLKLRDAVAIAGGYTYRADQTFAVVSRDGSGEVRVPSNGP